MNDVQKWITYNPLDPLWDLQPATSALTAKTQAELIVLRYRDHYTDYVNDGAIRIALDKIAQAIRNISCSNSS